MDVRNRTAGWTYNTPRYRETKQYRIRSKYYGRKMSWSLVHRLQIHLLATRSREHGAEFEPDEKAAEREHETKHPEH